MGFVNITRSKNLKHFGLETSLEVSLSATKKAKKTSLFSKLTRSHVKIDAKKPNELLREKIEKKVSPDDDFDLSYLDKLIS